MKYLQNLSDIVGQYDAFLFDVYGVLHNGKEVFPEARNCLMQLAAIGKHTVILTNAPVQAHQTIRNLEKVGIHPTLYQSVMTAGQLTHQALIARSDPCHARLGNHCYVIGTSIDEEILTGTGLHKVHTVEEADFLLVLGVDEWHHTLDEYIEVLQAALKEKLPLVCANPDLIVFKGETQELRAGTMAEYYQSHGGRVLYHGKPYPQIYQRALHMLPRTDLKRVLAVGDSFHTDYQGAQTLEIDFVLCFGRLSAYELGIEWETAKCLSPENLIHKILQAGYHPQYVVFEELVW